LCYLVGLQGFEPWAR